MKPFWLAAVSCCLMAGGIFDTAAAQVRVSPRPKAAMAGSVGQGEKDLQKALETHRGRNGCPDRSLHDHGLLPAVQRPGHPLRPPVGIRPETFRQTGTSRGGPAHCPAPDRGRLSAIPSADLQNSAVGGADLGVSAGISATILLAVELEKGLLPLIRR